MLVAQEIYYVTTGNYKIRKSLTVFYRLGDNGQSAIAAAIAKDDLPQQRPQGIIHYLPSIPVTATTYREFEKYRQVA